MAAAPAPQQADAWERSKENVMPVRGGRRAKGGLRGLAESGAAERGALDAERSDLERQVVRGGGSADDPLDDWLRCASPRRDPQPRYRCP